LCFSFSFLKKKYINRSIEYEEEEEEEKKTIAKLTNSIQISEA
jgi:hypothetical protein